MVPLKVNINKEGVHQGLPTCVCPLLGFPHRECYPPKQETVRRLAAIRKAKAETAPVQPRFEIPDDIPVTQGILE